MSVAVPIQKSIAPSAPRIGTARPRCQRYVPSAARNRYSTSKASPEASVSARFATAAGRSSGCTASVQPFSPACSTRLAGVLEPAAVVVRRAAFAIGRPHDLRHRVRELAVAVLADPPLLGDVALPQELALALQLRGLPVQLDEDRDLRTKHLRVERLEEVVDGTRGVAAEHVLLLLRDRGQEDDRDRLRPLALLDQLCRVEPVETRHLDVEQDAREVVVEQRPERLLAGLRADEVLAERLEDRAQGDEVLLAVVDEQQVDDRLCAHVVSIRSPAGSHSRP